jgi:hypothetical protein
MSCSVPVLAIDVGDELCGAINSATKGAAAMVMSGDPATDFFGLGG